LMWRSPAIWALSLPFAISLRTSISRSESSARIVRSMSGWLLEERTRRRTLAAIVGEIRDSPTEAAWMPCISSWMEASLRRYPPGAADGCWASTSAEACERPVQVDRAGPAPPGAGLGVGREPQVDHGAGDARADVRRNALAVARDRHARAERDHARVDRDDA